MNLKYIKRRDFLKLSASLLTLPLMKCSLPEKTKQLHLKVLQTSDLHGAIFPYDFINAHPHNESLAQISAYVKKQRALPETELLLLDNGDILQGQPPVYYFNFENTEKPHICSRTMNFMQYDAATIGNHDIEAGHPVYDRLVKEFLFPWLAANATDTKTGKPYFLPYSIIEKQGVRIAVLGLITPAIPQWLPPKIWAGIEFEDMIKSARHWAEKIQQTEKPDVLIGLFHAGTDATYNGQTRQTPKNENASLLVAEQVPGFDLILTGHDHQALAEKIPTQNGNKVLVLNPGSYACCVANADITLTWNSQKNQYDKEISGEIVQLQQQKADREFLAKFKPDFEEVNRYVSKPIGEFAHSISSRPALFASSQFVDLVHQIQLEISKAEISFAAPLSFDTQIQQGKVYVRDMFKLYKFENLLYTMRLSGQEIKDYLEFSAARWFNTMQSPTGHLLALQKKPDGNWWLKGQYFNFSSAAGLVYTVDVRREPGNRINIQSLSGGKEFSPEKHYLVAVNSYRGNGGGGHFTEGAKIPQPELQKRVVASTEKDLRYYMMKWIEKQGIVMPKKISDWRVIPQNFYQKGKEKDFKLLFG